jgi:hypothetical protein
MLERLLTNPVFLVFSSVAATSIITTIAYCWQKVRVAEIEAGLKQDMLERGMTPEEIQTVLTASSKAPPAWEKVRVAEIEAALKKDMLRRGMTPEEIQNVVAAFANAPAKKCRPESV